MNLANTPSARKEVKQKAEARSKAAKKAARTRKLSKQDEQAADRQAAVREQLAQDTSEAFFAKIRAAMAARNEKRRAKALQAEKVGSFGHLLKQAFSRD